MANPYQPPSSVGNDEEQSDAASESSEPDERDSLSYRLVFAYLAFIVLYVVFMDYLFRMQ